MGRGRRIPFRSTVFEAADALRERPIRLVVTSCGIIVGIAALVTSIGLATSGAAQIESRLDDLAADHLTVDSTGGDAPSLGWDAPHRAAALNGVNAAGIVTTIDAAGITVKSPVPDSRAVQTTVFAASPGAFTAIGGVLTEGTWINDGNSVRGDHVAVVGRGTAQDLNISTVAHQPVVRINDRSYTVVGILDDSVERPDLLNGVVVPEGTARTELHAARPGTLHVRVSRGAARQVASELPVALDPTGLAVVRIAVPPEPTIARDAVRNDGTALYLTISLITLLASSLAIGTFMYSAVAQRRAEIGLRRALGATRADIAKQFLVEAAIVSSAAAVVGSSVGIVATVAVAASRNWPAVIDPRVPLLAPLVGVALGLIAAAYPAFRAANTEPVEALRG